MLSPERRKVFVERNKKVMREIQAGKTMLRRRGVHLTLGEGAGSAGSPGTEDLAGIVSGFAERISSLQFQLVKQLVGAKFELHTVVVRVSGVGPPADDPLVAVHTAEFRMNCLSRSEHCGRRCARRLPGRDQIRKSCCETINSRITIDGLEEPGSMISDVASFEDGLLGNLPLETEGPLGCPLRAKVRSDARLIKRARIKNAKSQGRSQLAPYVRSCWHRQKRISSCVRSRESIQQYLWSCTGYIDIDIIVGGIVAQAESATENGFPMSGQEPAPLRGVGEAHARPPAILRRRDRWEGAHRERKRRIPECSGCVAFTLGGDIVKKVRRLTVIGPSDTKIQGQMALNLEVVSEVKEGILFPEVERGIARSDLNAVWNILSEPSPVREAECAVDIRKEDVGGTLIRKVNPSL